MRAITGAIAGATAAASSVAGLMCCLISAHRQQVLRGERHAQRQHAGTVLRAAARLGRVHPAAHGPAAGAGALGEAVLRAHQAQGRQLEHLPPLACDRGTGHVGRERAATVGTRSRRVSDDGVRPGAQGERTPGMPQLSPGALPALPAQAARRSPRAGRVRAGRLARVMAISRALGFERAHPIDKRRQDACEKPEHRVWPVSHRRDDRRAGSAGYFGRGLFHAHTHPIIHCQSPPIIPGART